MESCTNLEAEFWVVYKGLTMIFQKGFNKMIMETDAQEVIKQLKEGPSEKHSYKGRVEDTRIIFNRCQCIAQYVFREGNLCADALAKLKAEQPEKLFHRTWINHRLGQQEKVHFLHKQN